MKHKKIKKRDKLDYRDFICFCKAFEDHNQNCFDKEAISRNDENKDYFYDALYRDRHNYKSIVRIYWESSDIRWEVFEGWDDAYEELEDLYEQLFPSA
ncbi:hypothetical protein [Paenibacillus chitinolyticus]|uniref:hypothetical protein n=1 Tax=Paenibacillus chitinolyticus TaxID=79263 RepID=UPI001C45C92C|nr:hypothetical protein [Paenibacillus chitinolyticus]MBV6717163.1 hypothetical protein [Paenibacillus chitinolyticus]